MLTLVKLTNAEYVLSGVASGLEDYYMGIGESPGVWYGSWAETLGLEGVVEAEHLRALVNGTHPTDGGDLLVGNRERKVRAFDLTLSAPKSVSLLWAFGPADVSAVASQAHVEAAGLAMDLMESKAAVARLQVDGVRTRVATSGLAIATFVHRVSRDGDPDLHTHDVVPNIVRREDGSHCALDAAPLHIWAKAVGSVYQEQLRRILTQRLGVEWGPDRNGTREMVGFTPEQVRAFSKRTVQIEAHLERAGETYESPAARMRANDRASTETRRSKDRSFTPELLRGRWTVEAVALGIDDPEHVREMVCGRQASLPELSTEAVFARLIDAETGLCAHDSRFGEAHVYEAIAAMGAGRWDVARIQELAQEFLASEHVVRLMEAEPQPRQRRPPQWSTVAQRAMEDRVLGHLDTLVTTTAEALDATTVEEAIAAEGHLGPDQADAVRALCGPGPALRSLISPAGFGKTTAVHAGAVAAVAEGRPVIGVATTNRAVAELAGAGIPSLTIARLGIELANGECLRPNTVVILDEASQTSTADAEVVLAAVAATAGAQLWALGDVRQAQAVRSGGLAAEIDRLGRKGAIPAPTLTENRRQLDHAEQLALALYREGDVAESQAVRAGQGWEHQLATPADTRDALAAAAVADADKHGSAAVAVLAVSHVDCEDLADRMRAIRMARGDLGGKSITGPGWGPEPRHYTIGDRVLLHARVGRGAARLNNGTEATVMRVSDEGLAVRLDDGRTALLATDFVQGRRRDRNPNLSHAWVRTVEGSQGGTWSQVHLLGNAALDNFSAYVGQSRSKLPTHTWNVTRVIDTDFGGALAERRSPDEQVLAAMQRAPLKTFAALDDPWVTDRRLSAELAEHRAVVDTRPPDRTKDLAEAKRTLARAGHELTDAHALHAGATERLHAIGPAARMRGEGRRAHDRAATALERATDGLDSAQHQLTDTRMEVRVLEQAVSQRDRWDGKHGWRLDQVTRIQGKLDSHWAEVTLGAVREGDPLAFGVDRLRAARATCARDLSQIFAALPPQRSRELLEAKRDLALAQQRLVTATRALAAAEASEVAAHQRRWGRRDKEGITNSGLTLRRAQEGLTSADERVSACEATLASEQRSATARHDAVTAAVPATTRLKSALAELDHALDVTRPQRVLAMVRSAESPEHLTRILGPLPISRGGQRVWCALASEIEGTRDRGSGRSRPSRADRMGETNGWTTTTAERRFTGQFARQASELLRVGSQFDPRPADPTTLADTDAWLDHLNSVRALHGELSRAREASGMSVDVG